jgi:alpha-N-arabinofuranosidase
MTSGKVTGTVLTAKEIASMNTFENPDVVHSSAFNGAKISKNMLNIKLPAASVVVLEL